MSQVIDEEWLLGLMLKKAGVLTMEGRLDSRLRGNDGEDVGFRTLVLTCKPQYQVAG